jgi:hypothetical protein
MGEEPSKFRMTVMKVFIVHRDVDYEFGEVWGVHSTLQKAIDASPIGHDWERYSILSYDLDGDQRNTWHYRDGKWAPEISE